MDFGNEAGDDADPAELATYFVEQATFDKFLDTSNKILLATAKKGVDKSALLQWVAYNMARKDPDALVIKCRGADFSGIRMISCGCYTSESSINWRRYDNQ